MKEKQLTLLAWISLVSIILVGGGLVYYFQFVQLAAMRQEAADLLDKVKSAKKKSDAIRSLETQKKLLAAKEQELRAHIPDMSRLEYDKFANLLDSKREEAGVFIPAATWMPVRGGRPLPGRGNRQLPKSMNKVQYRVSVEGDFYQILRYLSILEKLERFIGIDNFNIARGAGSDGEGNFTRNMGLTLYSFTYQPEKEDEPTIDFDDQPQGQSTSPPE